MDEYGWLNWVVRVQSVTWAGITLTFDSSPIKGEGYMVGVVSCSPVSPCRLWILP